MSEWMTVSGGTELNSQAITCGVSWDKITKTNEYDQMTVYFETDTGGDFVAEVPDPASNWYEIDSYTFSAGESSKKILTGDYPQLRFKFDTSGATVTAWYEFEQ